MTPEWFALRSKPNQEEALSREAAARGFEIYYPRLRAHPVNPRARKFKPYFPGYMFVRADLKAVGFSALAWMPYSNGLVFFGSEPSPVADTLINAIRRRLDQIEAAGGELFDGLKSGETVRIEDGPFAGYEAIFDSRLSGAERVRVLLKLLSKQQIAVDLPAGNIQRKKRR